MRAELDASLCIPEKHPIAVEVDPISAQVGLSGKPGVDVTPLKLMLPKVAIDAPSLTLDLPDPGVTITVTAGNGLLTYLQDVSNFINGLNLSASNPGDVAVSVFLLAGGGAFLLTGAAQALITPTLNVNIQANLGAFRLTGDKPMTIDLGALRLHAESIKEDVRPMGLDIDLDDAQIKLFIDKLKAALSGCVVLNGGNPPDVNPPCGDPCPPVAVKPKVRSFKMDYERGNKDRPSRLTLMIVGDDFGQTRGQGFVVLGVPSAAYSPTQYNNWDDDDIRVEFQPAPPTGVYVLTVENSSGLSSQGLPVTVP